MLSEECFDIDFNLTDILCNIDDCASVTSEKRKSNGNLNLIGLSVSFDNLSNYKLNTGKENDASVDDLSVLLDSCHMHNLQSSGLISLAALANDHFSNNFSSCSGNKFEKCFSDSSVSNFKNDKFDVINKLDCLENILFKEKYEESKPVSSEDNLLNIFNYESCDTNKQSHKSESAEEILDDELIPDIDLSFCIKKNINNDKDFESSSPESSESGFDETDVSFVKLISSSSEEISSNENYPFRRDQVKSTVTATKQSLLSRAISARPKIDKSRSAKLRNIRNGMFKKYNPSVFTDYEQKPNSQIFGMIVDQSDQCVITSSFMTVSDQ